jgi:hypothetical protein
VQRARERPHRSSGNTGEPRAVVESGRCGPCPPGLTYNAFAEDRPAGTASSPSPRGDRRTDHPKLALRPSLSPDGRPEGVLGTLGGNGFRASDGERAHRSPGNTKIRSQHTCPRTVAFSPDDGPRASHHALSLATPGFTDGEAPHRSSGNTSGASAVVESGRCGPCPPGLTYNAFAEDRPAGTASSPSPRGDRRTDHQSPTLKPSSSPRRLEEHRPQAVTQSPRRRLCGRALRPSHPLDGGLRAFPHLGSAPHGPIAHEACGSGVRSAVHARAAVPTAPHSDRTDDSPAPRPHTHRFMPSARTTAHARSPSRAPPHHPAATPATHQGTRAAHARARPAHATPLTSPHRSHLR